MPITVAVEAVGIENIQTGDDPGNDLEIYGHLGAWIVIAVDGQEHAKEQHLLLNRMNPDQAQSITQGATLHIGTSTPHMTLQPGDWLKVGGHLKEQDTNPNDSMGDRYRDFSIAWLDMHGSGTHRVRFRESDQVAEAIFKITVL
ncbi:hypothetical protein ABQF34_08790 [Mycolicibacterium boenickei]